jgi:hypothetical protein
MLMIDSYLPYAVLATVGAGEGQKTIRQTLQSIMTTSDILFNLSTDQNEGVWRSGSASALHAEGLGFDPLVVHISFCFWLCIYHLSIQFACFF